MRLFILYFFAKQKKIMKLTLYFKKAITFCQDLPPVVKTVLLRGFILWSVFSILYYYVFLPHGRFVKAFTHLTSVSTILVLNKYYSSNFIIGSYTPLGEIIRLGNKNILYIMDTCSGFKLFFLYIGFIICAPGIFKRKIQYAIIGVIIIYLLNILRCVAISILVITRPHWTYIAHHYVFNIIVYSAIFFLWLSFLKLKKINTLQFS